MSVSSLDVGNETPPSPPEEDEGTASLAPGSMFGRYRVVRLLGRGGMGAVYLAHDTELDRPVALKLPLFSAGESPEVIRRFRREAKAAAGLDHPHLCPVYDVGQIDGRHYLTMPFIEGQPLSALLQDGPLDEARAAELILSLARAMHQAHGRGVIHRDLKPSNIMIGLGRGLVVMDFGVARRTAVEGSLRTQEGVLLGTPAYMAPEQVDGDVGAIGPAADIYALGVILYQLLTGWLPYRGTAFAVLVQIKTEVPERPSKLRPGLDRQLEAICLKAMAKRVEQRYGSMAELAATLDEHLQMRPPPPPVAARRPPPVPWRRLVLAAAGAAFLTILGIMFHIASAAAGKASEPPTGRAEVPAVASEAPAGQDGVPAIPRPSWRVGDRWEVETVTDRVQDRVGEVGLGVPLRWRFAVTAVEPADGRDCYRIDITCLSPGRVRPRSSLLVDVETLMLREVRTQLAVAGRMRAIRESYDPAAGQTSPVLTPLDALPVDLPAFLPPGAKGPDQFTYVSRAAPAGAKLDDPVPFAHVVRQESGIAGAKAPEGVPEEDFEALGDLPVVEVRLEDHRRQVVQLWQPGRPWPVFVNNGRTRARLVAVGRD